MQIIPSIDILDGKCVKLIQGKPGTGLTVSSNPVEIVDHWENEGAELLHIVDLDAAIYGSRRSRAVVKKVLAKAKVPAEVGGGIRSVEDAVSLLNAGARWIIMGTTAVEKPESINEMLKTIKPSQLIIALESRKSKVLTRGWTGETKHSIYEMMKIFEPLKISSFLYTDVEVEGTLKGVRFDNISKFVRSTRIPILYSGGISAKDEILNLKTIGVKGIIIGRALYERRLELKEMMELVKNA